LGTVQFETGIKRIIYFNYVCSGRRGRNDLAVLAVCRMLSAAHQACNGWKLDCRVFTNVKQFSLQLYLSKNDMNKMHYTAVTQSRQ